VTNVRGTHYILGSVLGPDPYPRMVRDFHRPIGEETRRQLRRAVGRSYPDVAIACVGGGSNALGLFGALLDEPRTRLIGVEAGGSGEALGEHAARFAGGALGVLHGTRTYVLQDRNGQVAPTHSVSAGLDYPAIGPDTPGCAPRSHRVHPRQRPEAVTRFIAWRARGHPAGSRAPRRGRGDAPGAALAGGASWW
jgi:tryptophan synthase beta chain